MLWRDGGSGQGSNMATQLWKDTEHIPSVGEVYRGEHRRDQTASRSITTDDWQHVLYTGTSMNPTLDEPDLLEVRPYGTARVRPGDVVCFRSPGSGEMVVHRVVSIGDRSPVSGRAIDGVTKYGIRTRGDNNAADDPWVLQADDIPGHVTAVRRGTRRRRVPGGWRGFAALRWARLGLEIRRRAGPVPHKLYELAISLGPFDRMLPGALRPRVVRFDARDRVFLKLVMGKLAVGQFDKRRAEWHISGLVRPFVDKQTLGRVCSLGDLRTADRQ